ncbi:CPBP family intramembrane glutamic endopeptidase [Dermacoccus sp. PAMC28757]|uniref:CPBP family intramembrane glutamic endopeptidase n=1 Tax=Dermacoccus sp. PAMC28757 TaxID=2762331 RepID=UPI002102CFCD|nr:CPBP family intramembrane glutamic endopeptidase [Dermacoccus sp. PAMC28757]
MGDSVARQRLACGLTLVVGTLVLAWSLSIEPADALFYPATALLAAVWFVGAFLARRPGGREAPKPTEARRPAADVALGAGVGAALAGAFLVGALVLTQIPALRDPVQQLLDHADRGVFVVVLVLTLVNGVAEETFFRGALYDALRGHAPVVTSTLVYTVVTAASGIWMLAFAGLVLGGVCALLRRRTGTLHAPRRASSSVKGRRRSRCCVTSPSGCRGRSRRGGCATRSSPSPWPTRCTTSWPRRTCRPTSTAPSTSGAPRPSSTPT